MPLVGFGTWQGFGDDALRALEVGYRHIDTATMYGNEDQIGKALRDSGAEARRGVRDDEAAVRQRRPRAQDDRQSLADLGLDYVDLWLIHWPPNGDARPDIWQQFVEIRDAGLTRAIGVSNYDAAQIDEITEATGVAPAVNQIKWSPALYDPVVVEAHRARGVVLEGYSPFKTSNLNDPVLKEIAERHGVTTRQVVLRWHIDHGFVVIPKSSNPARIAANFDVFGFALTAAEVARIDTLGV